MYHLHQSLWEFNQPTCTYKSINNVSTGYLVNILIFMFLYWKCRQKFTHLQMQTAWIQDQVPHSVGPGLWMEAVCHIISIFDKDYVSNQSTDDNFATLLVLQQVKIWMFVDSSLNHGNIYSYLNLSTYICLWGFIYPTFLYPKYLGNSFLTTLWTICEKVWKGKNIYSIPKWWLWWP